MPDRAAMIEAFIDGAGWAGAGREALAGDASSRRYVRLRLDERSAILADSPGDGGADEARRFAIVAGWLRARGYSAPEILADGSDRGLLLVEDLGDDLFARVLESQPTSENSLYSTAIDFLADLHRHPAPGFAKPLDGPALSDLLSVLGEWYVPAAGGGSTEAAGEIGPLVHHLYDRLNREAPVLSLRDFHAENLIWLPGGDGLRRVGLLDFQDAVAAHPAYDLVSLTQDARRDVPPELEHQLIARYLSRNPLEQSRFSAVVALLGAQRALRIIGVFARLVLARGKTHYLGYMPRVWGYLDRNLEHPDLRDLAGAVRVAIPEPTPERIHRIKAQCSTRPSH